MRHEKKLCKLSLFWIVFCLKTSGSGYTPDIRVVEQFISVSIFTVFYLEALNVKEFSQNDQETSAKEEGRGGEGANFSTLSPEWGKKLHPFTPSPLLILDDDTVKVCQ